MNILLYAESGAERQLLLSALEGIGFEPPQPVDLWEQLLAQIAVNRPDVAVLSYATLAAKGDDTVHSAGLTLKAIGVPVIVTLDAVYSAAAADIATQTGFTTFVSTPFEATEFAAALTKTTGQEVFVRNTTNVTNDFAAVTEGGAQAQGVFSEPDAEAVPPPHPEPTPPVEPSEDEPTDADSASVSDTAAFFGSRVQAAPRPPDVSDGSATEEIKVVDVAFADLDDDDDFDPFAEALAWSDAQKQLTQSGTPRPVAEAKPESDSAGEVSGSLEDSGAFSSPSGSSGAHGRVLTPGESSASRRVFVSAPSGEATAYETGAGGAATASADVASEPAVAISESGANEHVAPESTPVPAAGGDREVAVELPPDAGSLDDVDVPSVLHGLSVRRATGELVLQHDSLTRRVVVYDGQLGTVFQAPTAEDERKLLSTVGWKGGVFDFSEQDVPEAQFYSFGEGLELLYRGVERHIGINELAVALQGDLRRYPLRTDQVDRLSRVLGLEEVQTFAEASDGSRTLEQRLASAGADTAKVLRHAYFARLTGAVVFDDVPSADEVRLRFDTPDPGSTERPRIRATVSAPPLLSGANAATSASKVEMPESARERQQSGDAGADSGSHRATFDKLGQLWTQVSSQDAYEVFELEPGCGVEKVNARFYELVREYHPDRYARVQSGQIKNLAEKIFLHVRSLHTDLVQREETGNYTKRNTGGFGRGPSSTVRPTVPSSDSGLTARERRAKRRSAASRLAASQSGAQSAVRSTSSGRRPRTDSGGSVPSGPQRAAGESINRLRNRAESASSGSVPGVSGSHASVPSDGGFSRGSTGSYSTIANSRRLAPDQLMRNVKKSVENGAEDKAWDLLDLARVKGLKGNEADAYEVYLQSRRGELAADAAFERLEEIYANRENHRLERSQASMLSGHLKRLDERWADAVGWYDKSVEQDPDNQEAIRWLRFVKKRAEQASDAKKSGSFLDRLRAALNKKI